MAVTRLVRLAAALALTAGLLAAPAYAVPSPAASCTGVTHAGKADFNGDGYDDAVVGDPSATDGDRVGAGDVRVLYGGAGGVGSGGATTLTADSPGVATSDGPGSSSGDGFGWAVATAHIDADPCLDLVVSAPWQEVDGKPNVGAVYVIYGSPRGLGRGKAGTILTPDAWNGSAAGGLFGFSLASGDAASDALAAVVIGAPYTDRGPAKKDAGAAYIMWFTANGTPQNRKEFAEDEPRTDSGAVTKGMFGWSVAFGALSGNPGDPTLRELVVGAPRQPGPKAGRVVVLTDVARAAPSAISLLPPDLGVAAKAGARIGYALAFLQQGRTGYLAVGVPGAEVNGHPRAGAVAVFTSDGNHFSRSEVITEGSHGSATTVEDDDQFGRAVALGADRRGNVRLAVGMPMETSRVRQDGAAEIVPLTGGGKARDLNQAVTGIPGSPGEYAHFGWSVRFAGDELLVGVPDDRAHPTGSVIAIPDRGAPRLILPPANPQSLDFGAAQ